MYSHTALSPNNWARHCQNAKLFISYKRKPIVTFYAESSGLENEKLQGEIKYTKPLIKEEERFRSRFAYTPTTTFIRRRGRRRRCGSDGDRFTGGIGRLP